MTTRCQATRSRPTRLILAAERVGTGTAGRHDSLAFMDISRRSGASALGHWARSLGCVTEGPGRSRRRVDDASTRCCSCWRFNSASWTARPTSRVLSISSSSTLAIRSTATTEASSALAGMRQPSIASVVEPVVQVAEPHAAFACH